MKILCVDYGERRLGVAVADSDLKMAFPREGIDTNQDDPLKELTQIARKEKAELLVFGMPSHPDGRRHEKEIPIKKFAEALALATHLQVKFQDEAFSTVRAKEATAHFSLKKKQEDKKSLDSAAATIILQDFLEENF